jgi:hypothetical protein
MHDDWEICLTDFGRFVDISKRELIDAGRLYMRVLRNVIFTAFDLSELFYAKGPLTAPSEIDSWSRRSSSIVPGEKR